MQTSLRVLLLDDNPSDEAPIVLELRRAGFEPACTRAADESQFATSLDNALDIVLTYYHPPQNDPVIALALLKARHLDVPLIVVADAVEEAIAVECVRAGAADYILKSHMARLGEAVRREINYNRLRADQKDATQALAESEERFRAIYEQSRDGITIGYPNGRTVLYNPAMQFLTGFTHEEVNDKGWYNLVFPDPDDFAADERLSQPALDGSLRYVEARITCKSGDQRWAAFSLSPIHMGGEQLVMAVVTDITQRKHEDTERERTIRRERSLAHIVQALMNEVEPRRAIGTAIEQSLLATGMDAAGLWIADQATRTLKLAIHRGLPQGVIAATSELGYDSPELTARAFQRQRAEVVDDYLKEDLSPEARRLVVRSGFRCAVAVPLRHQDKTLGVITYGGRRGTTLDASDRDYFDILAGVLAVAVSDTQLHSQLRQQQRALGRLSARGALASNQRTSTETLSSAQLALDHLSRLGAGLETMAGRRRAGRDAVELGEMARNLERAVAALTQAEASPQGEVVAGATVGQQPDQTPEDGPTPQESWLGGSRVGVVVASDSDVARQGMRAVLADDDSISVVGETSNLRHVRSLLAELRPSVALLHSDDAADLLDVLQSLSRQGNLVPVLVLSGSEDVLTLHRVFEAGAVGSLSSGASRGLVVAAIHAAVSGGAVVDGRALARIREGFGVQAPKPPLPPPEGASALSDREREVLALICAGHTNRDIGDRMGLAETSVKRHVHSILKKLVVLDRTQAAVVALRTGLV